MFLLFAYRGIAYRGIRSYIETRSVATISKYYISIIGDVWFILEAAFCVEGISIEGFGVRGCWKTESTERRNHRSCSLAEIALSTNTNPSIGQRCHGKALLSCDFRGGKFSTKSFSRRGTLSICSATTVSDSGRDETGGWLGSPTLAT